MFLMQKLQLFLFICSQKKVNIPKISENWLSSNCNLKCEGGHFTIPTKKGNISIKSNDLITLSELFL